MGGRDRGRVGEIEGGGVRAAGGGKEGGRVGQIEGGWDRSREGDGGKGREGDRKGEHGVRGRKGREEWK